MRNTFSPSIVGLVRKINVAIPAFLVTYIFHAVVLLGVALGVVPLIFYPGTFIGKLIAFVVGSIVCIGFLALAVIMFAKRVWQPVVLVSAEPPEIVAMVNLEEISPTYQPGEVVIRPLIGKVIRIPANDQEIIHEIDAVRSADGHVVHVVTEFTYVFTDIRAIAARGGYEAVATLVDHNLSDVVRTVAIREKGNNLHLMENADFATKVEQLMSDLTIDGQDFFPYHGIEVREFSFKALVVPTLADAKAAQNVKEIDAVGDMKSNAKWFGVSQTEFKELPFEVKRAVQVAREDRETTTNIGIPALQQVIEMFGPALLERFVTKQVITIEEIQEALLNGDIDPDDLRGVI